MHTRTGRPSCRSGSARSSEARQSSCSSTQPSQSARPDTAAAASATATAMVMAACQKCGCGIRAHRGSKSKGSGRRTAWRKGGATVSGDWPRLRRLGGDRAPRLGPDLRGGGGQADLEGRLRTRQQPDVQCAVFLDSVGREDHGVLQWLFGTQVWSVHRNQKSAIMR